MSNSGNCINLFFDRFGLKLSKLETNHYKLTTIFIGPEGGWSESELDLAKKREFKIISLGPLTFRAETAAITSVFQTIDIFI